MHANRNNLHSGLKLNAEISHSDRERSERSLVVGSGRSMSTARFKHGCFIKRRSDSSFSLRPFSNPLILMTRCHIWYLGWHYPVPGSGCPGLKYTESNIEACTRKGCEKIFNHHLSSRSVLVLDGVRCLVDEFLTIISLFLLLRFPLTKLCFRGGKLSLPAFCYASVASTR